MLDHMFAICEKQNKTNVMGAGDVWYGGKRMVGWMVGFWSAAPSSVVICFDGRAGIYVYDQSINIADGSDGLGLVEGGLWVVEHEYAVERNYGRLRQRRR